VHLVIVLGLILIAWSGRHPWSLGWTVVVAATGSILVGLVRAYSGESITFTRVATITFPTIITLWVAWMGLRLLSTKGCGGQQHAPVLDHDATGPTS